MQPLILSVLLSAAGYIGDTKHQTAEVVQAIRYGTGIIPAVILMIGIILLAMVPINHKRELEIQAAIEEKHGKRLDAVNSLTSQGESEMKTIHLISHTHWDREWYRTFQQFRLRLVHLVDGLLDILAADRDYKHFMLDGQTIVLDDYLLMRPEAESTLTQHIRYGTRPDRPLAHPARHVPRQPRSAHPQPAGR